MVDINTTIHNMATGPYLLCGFTMDVLFSNVLPIIDLIIEEFGIEESPDLLILWEWFGWKQEILTAVTNRLVSCRIDFTFWVIQVALGTRRPCIAVSAALRMEVEEPTVNNHVRVSPSTRKPFSVAATSTAAEFRLGRLFQRFFSGSTSCFGLLWTIFTSAWLRSAPTPAAVQNASTSSIKALKT
jgi:hypothetical protein